MNFFQYIPGSPMLFVVRFSDILLELCVLLWQLFFWDGFLEGGLGLLQAFFSFTAHSFTFFYYIYLAYLYIINANARQFHRIQRTPKSSNNSVACDITRRCFTQQIIGSSHS